MTTKKSWQKIAKKTAVWSTVAVSSILLTGCGSTNVKNGPELQSNQKYTLTIWRTFDSSSSFQSYITSYEALHPNVTINYVQMPEPDYEVQSLNALAAGIGPDIWSIQNDWLPREADKLQPMPDSIKIETNQQQSNAKTFGNVFVPATEENIINGKIYGEPLYMDELGLYINQDLWRQAQSQYRQANSNNPNFDDSLFRKPPSTWAQLLQELPYLTHKDSSGNITQAGIDMGTSANVPFASDILSLLMMQNGTNMENISQKAAMFNNFQNDASGKPVYNGTNALTFYTSFANPSDSNYTWNAEQPNALQDFISGKLAILIGYEYYTQTLLQQAPTLNWTSAAIPQVQGNKPVDYASYWTETVTNNSKHPDLAWDFINYVATHPNGYLSATKRESAIIPSSAASAANDPFAGQTTMAADWPKGNYSDQIDQVFDQMIDNVTLNHQPAQQVINNAAAQTTTWLQKN